MSKLNSDYKQVILIREDLEMSPGKLGVQVNHATAMGMYNAPKSNIDGWVKGCIKVILLGVPDSYELVDLDYQLKGSGLPHFLVTDLGVTEFGEPTITALGIGPAESSEINKFTSKYNLYQPNEKFLVERFGHEILENQDVMELIKKEREEKFNGCGCGIGAITNTKKE
jgi:PTH2 family peptidyl-tRNA hydrolase